MYWDIYYNSFQSSPKIKKILKTNAFKLLVQADCNHIDISECLFGMHVYMISITVNLAHDSLTRQGEFGDKGW